MVSSSSSECSFFSFFFSPFFHRFHATTHFEPSYRQSLDHIIIKHVQGITISSYLAVGDSGSYSTESNVSQNPTHNHHPLLPPKKPNSPVFFLPKHCTLGAEAMVVEWPLSEVERGSVPEGKLSTLRMGVSQLDKSRWFRAGSFFRLVCAQWVLGHGSRGQVLAGPPSGTRRG